MIRFVYEDKGLSLYSGNIDCTPSSQLLLKCECGSDISFSCGAPLFEDELIACARKYENAQIVGFFDAPPGNSAAKRKYNIIVHRSEVLSEYRNRIVVIPVICTEYFILKSLNQVGTLRLNNQYLSLYNELENMNFSMYRELKFSSLEKAYKSILSSSILRCCINKSDLGKYYKESCVCMDSCSVISQDISLKDKANLLYISFPCFNSSGDVFNAYLNSLGYNVREVNPLDIRRREVERLNNISKHFEDDFVKLL